jgi:hypothetical protein
VLSARSRSAGCGTSIVPAMAIRWDWLEPLLTVPYVPALGPAHPAAITPGLFTDVTVIAGTGRFLPHDKDARWGGCKMSTS